MTDSTVALAEVPALLEERRRYEGWLTALDSRRDATPSHVFERVQSDYRGRLARVTESIASHRHAIEEERANVLSRHSLLEAEERMRRDERAELGLRAHVGELDESGSASAFAAVDHAIDALVEEKISLTARIVELNEMLIDPPAAEPARQSEAQGNAPVANVLPRTEGRPEASRTSQAIPRPLTPSGSFDDLAFLDALVGGESNQQAARSAAASTATSATSPTPAQSLTPARSSTPVRSSTPMRASTPVRPSNPAPPPAQAPSTPVPVDMPSVPSAAGGSSVAGEGDSAIDEPLAMNVTGNRPIVLRTGTST
ncbi:MAG: DUF963 domain-containing protein, partial [Acetobacteraceae bacterium]